MRTVETSSAFKKDFKKAKTIPHHSKDVGELLEHALEYLVLDKPLPDKFKDHPLSGNWSGYRDCHLKPDLVLIYGKTGTDILRLARLGSHSELFG